MFLQKKLNFLTSTVGFISIRQNTNSTATARTTHHRLYRIALWNQPAYNKKAKRGTFQLDNSFTHHYRRATDAGPWRDPPREPPLIGQARRRQVLSLREQTARKKKTPTQNAANDNVTTSGVQRVTRESLSMEKKKDNNKKKIV